MDIKTAINHLINKEYNDFKETVSDILHAKTQERIEDEKYVVAQTLFGKELEEASAKDYVEDEDSDEEATDYEPRSKGEKKFKDKHKISKKEYPAKLKEESVVQESVLASVKKIANSGKKADITFKDGEEMSLSPDTAKKLVSAMEDLSGNEKKKFADKLEKDEISFMDMVDFAHSNRKNI